MAEEAEIDAEEKRWLAKQKQALEDAGEAAINGSGATGTEASEAVPTVLDEERPPSRIRLDKEVEASGFGRHMQKELEDVSLS
jgi:hypothetical protein